LISAEYSSEGDTVTITLTGIPDDIWGIWNDSERILELFGNTIVTSSIQNMSSIQVSISNAQATITIININVNNAGVYMSKQRNAGMVLSSVILVVTGKYLLLYNLP